MTGTTAARATEVLRALVGSPTAGFHDGQLEAIEAIVDDRRRALVVQRTGWGKSAVYFIATKLLRERGAGPTILISPLLALMRDQIAAAARSGVTAASISSANQHEWGEIEAALSADAIDVLLISPERLNHPEFREQRLPGLLAHTGLLVIDEAHCISDWGHDFRPDYRRIGALVAAMPASIPVLATTATANERVVEDVAEQLGVPADGAAGDVAPSDGVLTIRGPLARRSLRLGVLRLPDAEARLAWLVANLAAFEGSGIIYALTVAAAADTAELLRDAGHEVFAYTGQTDPEERERLERALKDNQVKALVATNALGMGFDKPDLGFVVHLGAPSSPVAYYQQVGRAGRGSENADVLLLPGDEDQHIWEYFATASMPRREHAAKALDALSAEPQSLAALEAKVELRRTQLELLLKVLDVDGAVERVRGGWVSTGRPWQYDEERYDRIAAARQAEQAAMLEYERIASCRMAFLQRSLDDQSAEPCGRCDNCAGPWFTSEIDGRSRAAARASLHRVGITLAPRKQWPSGMGALGISLRGRIPPEEQPATGMAVARLTELGWGMRIRELLADSAQDARIETPLVDACVDVLRQWPWAERPTAVVGMPSARRPLLLGSLAAAISTIGRLPLLGTIDRSLPPSGHPGGNSAYRLRDVAAAFTIGDELAQALAANTGPVLLVDDLVDSGWTMTIASRLLLRAGADAVLPFALATQR